MEDYRLEQTGQEVQDILNGAAMDANLQAEVERATDAEGTLQGNIDAEERARQDADGLLQQGISDEENRAKRAEEANAGEIEGIKALIPSTASEVNKLADTNYVNSSIQTATAEYRGDYNVVTDLHLAIDATHAQIETLLPTVIAEADKNDYCYVMIPTNASTPTEIAKIERYKMTSEGWKFEYDVNNSTFTAEEWAAIKSGITSGLVGKLNALPTNADLLLLLAGKQDVLTFDATPVQESNNPVKSGGVYSAIDDEKTARMNSDTAIHTELDGLQAKVPATASSDNKLVDQNQMNSSISTATATFRGDWNVVSDLHLVVDATREQIAAMLPNVIATADNNDYCYVEIPTSAETPTQIERVERYKYNGTAWGYEYVLNNSGFTAAQWAAINSMITSGLVAKLTALPTNTDLLAMLAQKQDNLTFDTTPTENSTNPVTSGGVFAADKALSDAIEAILLLIPSAASTLNKLVDTALLNSSISTATATFRGTYNLVSDLGLGIDATEGQIAAALLANISTADNNDYSFVQIPTSAETPAQIARTDRYKFNGTAWAFEYTLNTSGFTAAQWAAINSTITSTMVAKLNDLPTAAELQEALGTLTSGITAINQKIPSTASQSNKLVDNASMESYIAQVINILDASFNVTSTDGHITLHITQVDGVITSVQVQSTDIASAADLALKASQADLTALASRVSTAEGNITSLTGRMGTAETNIANLQQLYNNLQQSKPVPVTALPGTGQQQGVIYRLAGTTSYSDYMWDGSSWVLMATYNNAIDPRPKKASQNLVISGGVFDNIGALDVSELNATENPHTLAQYADLSAALAAIPTDYQKGGMSIKFVQSSDNKYVQFRYKGTDVTTAAFTNIANWQKISGSSKTIVVAAYDSSEDAKTSADIVANSENSGISAINAAISILTNGGRVYLRQGTYSGTNYVDISVSNIIIEGESYNTYIKRTGANAANPVMVASGVVNSFVETVKFDYKPAGVAYRDIMFGSGIASEFSENLITVAASNSTQHTKDNAAYICDGTNDREVIQHALSNLPSTGGTVKLCAGTYTIDTVITFTKSNSAIIGDFGATKIEYTAGFSGTVALSTQNSSYNCTVIGIDFGAKYLNLDNSGSGVAYQCVYGGSYHTYSKLEERLSLNPYTYLIAASDAPAKVKVLADYICDGTSDNVEINNAITQLKNAGKTGVIQLSTGNFNFGSGVIQITTSGIELRGCGYATVINRTNPLALEVLNSSNNIIVRGINFGTHTLDVKGSTYLAYVYDCWIGGVFYHEYTHNNNIKYIEPAQGIAGINSAITSFGNNGGTIVLNEGTYEGTAGITMNKPNIIIEGKGYKTVIKRSSGNDIFGDPGAKNSIIRNVRFYNQFQQNGKYPTERYRIENCWNNDTLINQCDVSNVIINIGCDYFFKKISTPYAKITSTSWIYSNRFEFHIHGHIVETGEVLMDKPVSLVGHNALVEFTGPKGAYAWFFDIAGPYVQNMLSWWPVVVKDIHFIKTGCFNYWNGACVSVTGSDWKFINCVFENASSSPSPFDNSTQEVGAEDHNGCRRHGIAITIPFTKECRTEFHNCIGIGSPYGFQSCRGWYFMTGSPKLYDCVGIGGGIGEFGHGIVCHEASDATLFNFRGYAGEHSYRQAAGIRYQASGKNSLFDCIGYGSKGTQRKSEGIPYSALHQRCVEVGITDESFFYDGTDVDYDGLTIKTVDDGYNASRLLLGNAIQPSDITFTELGGVSEEGFGISLWNHNGRPIIENCKGYAGHGSNSEGIRIESNSAPLIKEGYFGPEYQNFIQDIIKDNNGYCIFSVPTNVISQYTPYVLKNVGITIRGGNYMTRHLLLHLETDESTPQVIVDGYDMYNRTSIGLPTIERIEIPAGVGLKAYITENGSVVSDYTDAYFYLMLTCVANPSGAKGCSIRESAKPQIVGATMEHEAVGLGIYTTSTEYLVDKCMIESDGDAIATDKANLKVFDSAIRGTVDSGITFVEKTFINSSSNYSI